MHFADALTARTERTSPVCVGLDPQIGKLPEGVSRDIEGLSLFCRGIIDAVADTACCVKPQSAYFELLGWEGVKVCHEVSAYAKSRGLLVILDAKRNDIGSTCEAYADAYLSAQSPFDALTVSPYLGSDGILPFMDRCQKNDKGIFILVKTSNPSSGDLQDLPVGDEAVHEHMAQLTEGWALQALGESGLSCVGAVVGATYPEELKYLRTIMPNVPFLIPGYGAQGATAEDVKYGFLMNGMGAIVNSSRAIIHASAGNDWKEAAAKAARVMADDIASVLRAHSA